MPAETALITLVPAATPVANPPAVIVATVVVTELQVAVPVKFCVELDVYKRQDRLLFHNAERLPASYAYNTAGPGPGPGLP